MLHVSEKNIEILNFTDDDDRRKVMTATHVTL